MHLGICDRDWLMAVVRCRRRCQGLPGDIAEGRGHIVTIALPAMSSKTVNLAHIRLNQRATHDASCLPATPEAGRRHIPGMYRSAARCRSPSLSPSASVHAGLSACARVCSPHLVIIQHQRL